MLVLSLNVISILLVFNACFAVSSGPVDPESEIRCHSSTENNGLIKFIKTSNMLLYSDDSIKDEVKKRLDESYFNIEDAMCSLHGDTLNMVSEPSPSNLQSQGDSNKLVHVPREKKVVPLLHKLKMRYKNLETGHESKLHIPRIKHLKKMLPKITIEPYQRVMSFSIEVCMIPSIWYLELIHCMYMGMARYFTGMTMSYSLQDIVGSAIMSIGYKDEAFSILNCYNSVSLVADDRISGNYDDICSQMETCLKSKPFLDSQFSVLRPEFEGRINSVYSALERKGGEMSPIQFARYSVLYSLYFVKNKMKLQAFYPERNFLPIRMMLTSLGIYYLGGSANYPPRNLAIVEKSTNLVSRSILSSLDTFDIDCPYELLPLFETDSKANSIMVDFFCKEIFSFGFVDESTDSINITDDLEVVTKPSRILIPSYLSVIPRMDVDLEPDSYSTDWMGFLGTWEAGSCEGAQRERSRKKIFMSSKLRKTRRKDPEGVRNTFEGEIEGNDTGSRSKSKKLSKRLTGLFNRSRRRSDSITNRIIQKRE